MPCQDYPHRSVDVRTGLLEAEEATLEQRRDGVTDAPSSAATIASKPLAARLYVSHFLSTWNSRLFEAAVVYFVASIFPDTLLPISLYAAVRNVAAIALTVPVGRWIDSANRLTILRISIIGQRVSVAGSCGLFWAMLQAPGISKTAINGLFSATVLLACVEKLAASVNLISVERDWVVVITEGDEIARRAMNARMRRIDLFCKLVGPLAIALVAAASIPIAIYATLGMNVASVFFEYTCIEKVFKMVPALRRSSSTESLLRPQEETVDYPDQRVSPQPKLRLGLARIRQLVSQVSVVPSLRFYFSQSAVIPSFTLSLLYMTVLAFSGQMLTYLLVSGINLWQVGLIRAVSTVFELSATWVAPRLMKRIGVIRTGLWSISWQMTWLAGGTSWLLYFYGSGYPSTDLRVAAGLAAAVAFSRVGLWGFDLSAQNIVQDEIDEDHRGVFSTIEASFQNLFDLLSWALTLIWSNPASFQWPVIISVAVVYVAGGLYAHFLRRRRGHLLHPPPCFYAKADD